jgi:ABC-type sugar transport system ATPase subunit
MPEILLEMKNMYKDYGGVLVLKDVSLELNKGEVLALVGENGAGKSTLIKILSGSIPSKSGEIFINGEKQHFASPIEAINKGISVIYQELNYFKDLTIAENILSGRMPQTKMKKIDWKKADEIAQESLVKMKLNFNPRQTVGKLSVAEKQLVEIAKAISRNNRIIVMDEPTAALNDTETNSLFEIIKTLRDQGISFIYISHRLEEIFQVADRVMVLRDGQKAGELDGKTANREDIIKLMVGREITQMYPRKAAEVGEVIFRASGISGGIVNDVSLNIRKGEIVTVFGLMGSGLTELFEMIFGVRKRDAGEISVDGKKINVRNAGSAMAHGMAYMPPERKVNGLIMSQTIKENIISPSITRFSKGWVMDEKRETSETQRVIDNFSIRCKGMYHIVKSLSGGNQQKVLLGKWINRQPKIIMINEPTRGVDVGTKVEIYKMLEALCVQGFCILMISSELPEVLALSDRVYVLCKGKLAGEFNKDQLSQELLLEYAIGGK